MPPKRHWRQRIADIIENIEHVEDFTRGLTFEEFRADLQKVMAVERCFEIIGEASRHVPDPIKARVPEIPWRDLREMRNVISHVYHAVSMKLLWTTIRRDLPSVAPRLRELLEQDGEEGVSQLKLQ